MRVLLWIAALYLLVGLGFYVANLRARVGGLEAQSAYRQWCLEKYERGDE